MAINPSQLQVLLGWQLLHKVITKGMRDESDAPTIETITFDNVEEGANGTFTADLVLHRIENFHMTVQLTDEIKNEIGGYVASGRDAEKAQGQVVVVCDIDTRHDAVKWHLVINQVDESTVTIQSSEFIGNPRNITVTNKSCSYGGVNYREFDKYWNIVRPLWEDTAAKAINASYSGSLVQTNETFPVRDSADTHQFNANDQQQLQTILEYHNKFVGYVNDYCKRIQSLKGADLVVNNSDEYEMVARQAAGAKILIASEFAPKVLNDTRKLASSIRQLMAMQEQFYRRTTSTTMARMITNLSTSVSENFLMIAGKYSSIKSNNFSERTYGHGTGIARYKANARSNDELCDQVAIRVDNILSSLQSARAMVQAVAEYH